MKSNDNLIKYLNKNFTPCDIPDLLKKNSLYFKFADQFADKRTEEKGMMLNRVLNSVNMAVACNIFSDLKEMNIEYISFKGFVLSQLLYANPNERAWGDIDFWVEPQHFDNVYQYLLEKGFSMLEENGMSNPHHVVLASGKTVVELHRNILHPMLGIHEEFLLGNLQPCTINQHNITTFNETAGILHLIYHLYMDAYLASYDMYSAIMKKKIPKANRFLYRAYEIALFSEKYSDKINWEAIEADLKRQKLRAIFGRMVFDIVEIFPEAFPDSFLDTVSRLDYKVENENDRICQYTIEAGQIGDNIKMGRDIVAADVISVLGIDRMIDHAPDGGQTLLGEENDNPYNLSGGEWSRLGIARNAQKGEPILYIMDEPTAVLDPIAESKIFESFDRITKGKTTIFISHRLGMVSLADRIIVLDGGMIAEQGTHIELMERKGLYHDMYCEQMQLYER